MRVTQGMMSSQMLRNLNRNLEEMNNWQMQLSTGRKLNNPHDDPIGVTFSMRYRSELSANEKYQQNVDAVLSNLDFTDTVLEQAGNVVQKLRELAVRGGNGTNPESAMEAIRVEVEEMYNQLVDIANSQFKGKYIFNGELTEQQPYTAANAAAYTPDTGKIDYEIGPGLRMPINLTGNEVFGEGGSDENLFKVVQDLMTHLSNQDHEAVGDTVALLDERMEVILGARAQIGARINRLELTESRLKDMNVNLQTIRSKVEDADIAGVITNLKMSENVYQASLSVGAKLIQPSLVDFLR